MSKQIAVLRKLKYTLNRDFLSRIYLTFIRPLFEYASEVWDNLTLADSDRLEKFQLETARIVTGLPSYCSRTALYFETGWDTLKTRREHKKLCLMYKMVNNTAPNYLCELLPPRVGENTMYNLRNTDDFTLPYCRLNLLKRTYNDKAYTSPQLFGQIYNFRIFIKFFIHEVKKTSKFWVSGPYLYSKYQQLKFLCLSWHFFVRIYRQFNFFLYNAVPPFVTQLPLKDKCKSW